MISLILLKLFTFSQILQGVPKLSHATVYISAVKQLIASKIKVFVYILYVCVLCIFIMYIYYKYKHMHVYI